MNLNFLLCNVKKCISDKFSIQVEAFRNVYKLYGGFNAIINSPYFWAAVLISILNIKDIFFDCWWDKPISILPNIIGFTIGAYAIVLSSGSEKFREFIAGDYNGKKSIFLTVNSSFVHIIVVQVTSLILSITLKNSYIEYTAYLIRILSIVGYIIFIYSLTLIISVSISISIFTLSDLYNEYITKNKHH